MKKAVFSSDQLPSEWGTRRRFGLWREMWTAQYGAGDMAHPDDKPFATRAEFVPVAAAGAFRFETTTEAFSRTRQHAATDLREDFLIGFSHNRKGQWLTMRDRDFDITSGTVMVMANGMPCASRTQGHVSWLFAVAPLAHMRELVPDADDRIATLLDSSRPAVRHLERYLEFLLGAPEVEEDPALGARAHTILIDLMTLSLGAAGEAGEIARARGLRAARIREVLAEIQTTFSDPACSPTRVALKQGLSVRYLHELLQQTGLSFSERVLELRLQQARAMLTNARHDRLKVSEIALACGFNEVSYFNRSFRRRFGASPTQYRGNGGA